MNANLNVEEKYLILIGGNNELLPFVTIIEKSTADGINIDIRKIPITPNTGEVVSTLIGELLERFLEKINMKT